MRIRATESFVTYIDGAPVNVAYNEAVDLPDERAEQLIAAGVAEAAVEPKHSSSDPDPEPEPEEPKIRRAPAKASVDKAPESK